MMAVSKQEFLRLFDAPASNTEGIKKSSVTSVKQVGTTRTRPPVPVVVVGSRSRTPFGGGKRRTHYSIFHVYNDSVRKLGPFKYTFEEAKRHAIDNMRIDPLKKSNKTKRTANQGRHYADDEWVEFILDGFPETLEVDVDYVPITDALQAEVDKFMEAADKAVEECSRQFPPAEEIYLEDADYADIYHTLVEAGVGIWDGRWDHYYPNYTQKDWDKLSDCLKKKLERFADFSGAGSLNDAFMEAVYAAERDQRGKSTKTKRSKSLTQLKNKLMR